jgi:hypothetical protein
MAIVSVVEIPDGRGGGDSLKKSMGSRKHTRSFRVTTSSNYDGSHEVLLALQNLGSVHPTDSSAYCQSRKADPDGKSKKVWIARLEYSTDRTATENPLADPAVIEWDTDSRMEPFFRDINGDVIANSAGEPFEDTVKDDVSFWTITITKNISYMPTWIDTYRDAVNSDAVLIDGKVIAAGTAKIKKIHVGKWQVRNNIPYRELNLVIKIQDSWKKYVLDQGLHCVMASGPLAGTLFFCMDGVGSFATKPMLLDGSGGQLSVPLDDPSHAVFLEFDIRNSKAFSVLPLN